MKMRFNEGDILSINDIHYVVKGCLEFSSKKGGSWPEYYMTRLSDGVEFWLSVDDKCLLWEVLSSTPNLSGYEVIESGVEIVKKAIGDVDCEVGDTAEYKDYSKRDERSYISVEKWDDETEYSSGSMVSPSKIKIVKKGDPKKKEEKQKSGVWKYILMILALFLGFKFCGSSSSTPPTIESVLSENGRYIVETYLTGADKEYAQIYRRSTSGASIDGVTKEIIAHIEGNTTQVIENPVDSSSVIIVTPDEFCVVYRDSITNKTLVHLCDKDWMTDNSSVPLYHANSSTEEFAKSLHVYNTYGADSLDNSNSNNHHHRRHSHIFTALFFRNMSTNGRYNDYSRSVRQESVNSRSSSGGGHGGWGK